MARRLRPLQGGDELDMPFVYVAIPSDVDAGMKDIAFQNNGKLDSNNHSVIKQHLQYRRKAITSMVSEYLNLLQAGFFLWHILGRMQIHKRMQGGILVSNLLPFDLIPIRPMWSKTSGSPRTAEASGFRRRVVGACHAPLYPEKSYDQVGHGIKYMREVSCINPYRI